MAEWEEGEAVADPIGARLKTAREGQGMSLDDVAAKTRVPIRHLVHMENGEWDELPAPTYSVGFARAYATAVGLNASEIGSELRAQLVGTKTTPTVQSYYEPADPARVAPRSLAVFAAGVAVLALIAYFVWRTLVVGDEDSPPIAQAEPPAAVAPEAPAEPPPAAAPAAGGPVTLTAISDVWLRISEADGSKLYEDTLKAGERYDVPATATRPQILTGRPDALRVTVGTTEIPPLGMPNKSISGVSLLPADLLARATPQAAPAPAPAAAPRPAPRRSAPRPPASAQPVVPDSAPVVTPAPTPAPAPVTPPAGTP